MATVAEMMTGYMLDEILKPKTGGDVIDVIADMNLTHTVNDVIEHYIGVDANDLAQADVYGDATNDTNHIADRTYTSADFTIPYSKQLKFKIGPDQLKNFGISRNIFNSEAHSLALVDTLFSSPKLKAEIARFRRRFIQYKRDLVKDMLKAMGRGTEPDYQKPLGVVAVGDAADRPDFFTFGNKFTAALDADKVEYNKNIDLFASGMKDEFNYDADSISPDMLITASSYTLAEGQALPDLVLDANERAAGRTIGTVSAVGSYGDTDNSDDYVFLSMDADIYATCVVAPDGSETGGVWIDYEWNNGTLVITMRIRRIIEIKSPLGITKGVIPAA